MNLENLVSILLFKGDIKQWHQFKAVALSTVHLLASVYKQWRSVWNKLEITENKHPPGSIRSILKTQLSVFLSWPTVNNCDLFMSGCEQMPARMGNAQRLRAREEKMHTIPWWQRRRQFSVPFRASVTRHCPRQGQREKCSA